MAEFFEAGQYGFYIWTGFAVVAVGLLGLGVQSRMKFKKLSVEFETLKEARGSRRKQHEGNDNGS